MRRKDKVRKVDRAFQQRGLRNMRNLVAFIEFERIRGRHLQQMGSSSIVDPQAHIARVKSAMGIGQSAMDGVWAAVNDDASLYVGFHPGRKPKQMDPLDWLNLFADALPRIPRESAKFVDTLMGTMVGVSLRGGASLH
jgi:hypothetical protein